VITSWQSSDGSEACIRAKSNFSLDAGGLVNLLAALGAVTLCLAGVLAWQGYWPILLIAVVQVILVSWILFRAWQRAWFMEVIEIDPRRICVQKHVYRDVRRMELDTAWAKVEIERPEVRWYGPRVILRSKHRSVELGSFLTTPEKHRLAELVRNAIGEYSVIR
jgi:uncharacterized membrane protein